MQAMTPSLMPFHRICFRDRLDRYWPVARLLALYCAALFLGTVGLCSATPVVKSHGIAAPVAMASWGGGAVAVDGRGGQKLVVAPILAGWDDQMRRAVSFLFVDAATGRAEQTPTFFGDGGFADFVSGQGKLYYTVGRDLLEVDLRTHDVTSVGTIPPKSAASFTADDRGIIYAMLAPQGELLAYDPQTKKLVNYGPLDPEPWDQYSKVAADGAGWIYAVIRHKRFNVVAFRPDTRERRELIGGEDRKFVMDVDAFRAADGAVYVTTSSDPRWRRFHAGKMEWSEKPASPRVAFPHALRDPALFADGTRLALFDVPNGRLVTEGKDGKRTSVEFRYRVTNGARIYSLVAGEDGKVYGSTGQPLRIFRHAPDETENVQHRGFGHSNLHINAWARLGGKLYGAMYNDGALLEFTPPAPGGALIETQNNPRVLYREEAGTNLFGRPTDAVAHPDGRHVIVSGGPARALSGGGLLIYDVPTAQASLLGPSALVPDQTTQALVVLPGGDLLGGTTTASSTGGEHVVGEARVYRLDWATRTIAAEAVPVPGATAVYDLALGPGGFVYGLASNEAVFVMDPRNLKVLAQQKIVGYGETTGSPGLQTTNVMVAHGDAMCLLLTRAIVRLKFVDGKIVHDALVRRDTSMTGSLIEQGGRLYTASGAELVSVPLGGSGRP